MLHESLVKKIFFYMHKMEGLGKQPTAIIYAARLCIEGGGSYNEDFQKIIIYECMDVLYFDAYKKRIHEEAKFSAGALFDVKNYSSKKMNKLFQMFEDLCRVMVNAKMHNEPVYSPEEEPPSEEEKQCSPSSEPVPAPHGCSFVCIVK